MKTLQSRFYVTHVVNRAHAADKMKPSPRLIGNHLVLPERLAPPLKGNTLELCRLLGRQGLVLLQYNRIGLEDGGVDKRVAYQEG